MALFIVKRSSVKLFTHMKLCEIKRGFLINFNLERLKDGLKSFVLTVFFLFFMSFMVNLKVKSYAAYSVT